MNLLEIQTALKDFVDLDTLPVNISRIAVNWAYSKLIKISASDYSRFKIPVSEINGLQWSWRRGLYEGTLAAGSLSINLKSVISAFKKIRFIKIDGSSLTSITEKEFNALTITDGEPTKYCDEILANIIYLNTKTTDDKQLTVGYIKTIQQLKNSADTPVFDEDSHDILILGALAYIWDYPEFENQKSKKYYADFLERIKDMYNEDIQKLDNQIFLNDIGNGMRFYNENN